MDLPIIKLNVPSCNDSRYSIPYISPARKKALRDQLSKNLIKKTKPTVLNLQFNESPKFISKHTASQPNLPSINDFASITHKDRFDITHSVKRILKKRIPRNAANSQNRFESDEDISKNSPNILQRINTLRQTHRIADISKLLQSSKEFNMNNSKFLNKNIKTRSCFWLKSPRKNDEAVKFMDHLTSTCDEYYDELLMQDNTLDEYPKKLAKLEDKSNILSNGMYEYCIEAARNGLIKPKITLRDIKRNKPNEELAELDLTDRETRDEFLRKTFRCSQFVRKLRVIKTKVHNYE